MSARQKKIIVPVDSSNHAKLAVKVGAEMAAIHGSELVLLHAVEPVSALTEFLLDKNYAELRHDAAVKALEKFEDGLKDSGVKYSLMVEAGKPYQTILDASEQILAEMIVMGSQGSEHNLEGMLGSNTNKVVRGANCPVITVNAQSASGSFSKILLAVDPEFGIKELRSFLELYKDYYNPQVDIVTVIDGKNITDADRKKTEEYLRKQKETLKSQGINNVTTSMLEGDVVSATLVQHQANNGHDMIWMETHGRSGLSSFLMSSITEEVIAYSKVPVLSLRPDRPVLHTLYYHENLPI